MHETNMCSRNEIVSLLMEYVQAQTASNHSASLNDPPIEEIKLLVSLFYTPELRLLQVGTQLIQVH